MLVPEAATNFDSLATGYHLTAAFSAKNPEVSKQLLSISATIIVLSAAALRSQADQNIR